MSKFPVSKILTPAGVETDATDFTDVTTRFSGEQLLAGFARIGFLWRHWIPRGKVIVLAGAGGAGKSSIATGFAVARALGLPRFLGVSLTPGSTLFVTGEDEPVDYGRRMAAWIDVLCEGKQTRETADLVARQISFLNLVGTDARLVLRTKSRDFTHDEANAEGIAARVRALDPQPDLVVIETAARFGGDESNQAHSALVRGCEVIAQGTGASVVIVSHTGKANARENMFDAYAGRGGSSLSDDSRGSITFGPMPRDTKVQRQLLGRTATPEEKKFFLLVLSKTNFAPKQDPIILKPRSNLDSLVLEETEGLAPAAVAFQRNKSNIVLANAVETLIKAGEKTSVRFLRARMDLLPGIPFRGVDDAVEDAIEDGVLAYGVKGARGYQPIILGTTRPKPVENGGVHELSDWVATIPFGSGVPAGGWTN